MQRSYLQTTGDSGAALARGGVEYKLRELAKIYDLVTQSIEKYSPDADKKKLKFLLLKCF